MKDAVIRDIAGDCIYSTEYMIGYRGYDGLRVDVHYSKNKREYLVECETRPNIKRLIDKGKRRNEIAYRTMYLLIVPSEYYHRIDWSQLHGYFDQIIAYDTARDRLAESQELRFLGSLRDTVLNALVPIYMSDEAKSISRWIRMQRNLIVYTVKDWLHCKACKHNIATPWLFCPRDDCPDSSYWTP